jgi:hypothetical protein
MAGKRYVSKYIDAYRAHLVPQRYEFCLRKTRRIKVFWFFFSKKTRLLFLKKKKQKDFCLLVLSAENGDQKGTGKRGRVSAEQDARQADGECRNEAEGHAAGEQR